MSSQGKVQISTGNPLEWGGVVNNVATNEADIALMREAAADVSGKTITPTEVIAKRMSLDEALIVDGNSIQLGDGVVSARHLVTSERLIVNQAQIGDAIITGNHMDLGPNGELSALSANLGTMTAGVLDVTSGNLDIGSGDTGISILGGVLMQMKYEGVVTISMDASTGLVMCNNFNFTKDGAPEGAIQQFDTGIQIGSGDRTLGDTVRTFSQPTDPSGSFTLFVGDIWIDTDNGNLVKRWDGDSWESLQDADIGSAIQAAQDAQAAADGKVVTFVQASIPTSEGIGDLWLDSDDNYKVYRAASAGANEIKAGEWVLCDSIGTALSNAASAYTLASGKITTFYQTSSPTALATGDLWVDTDDGNKLYRWNGSSWVSIQDARAGGAVQDSDYIDLNASNQIININLNGITIGTATSGQRVQLNSTGVACYDSSGNLKTYMDIYGFHCRRGSSATPQQVERASFLSYAGNEYGFICGHKDENGGLIVAGQSGKLYLFSGLYDTGAGGWGYYDYDTELSAGGDVIIRGNAGSGTGGVVYIGHSSGNATDLNVYNGLLRAKRLIITDGAGTDRASIYSGTGVPDSGVGAVGDLYIRVGTAQFYQKTAASTWTQIS